MKMVFFFLLYFFASFTITCASDDFIWKADVIWKYQKNPRLFEISFCDSKHGMIAGNYLDQDLSSNRLCTMVPTCLRTDDGGRHWMPVWTDSADTYGTDSLSNKVVTFRPSDFKCISYLDTSLAVGFCSGYYSDDLVKPYIIRSTDKGENWQRIIIDSAMNSANSLGYMARALKMFDKKNGACCTKINVYLTEDSAKSWQKLNIPVLKDYIVNDTLKYSFWDIAYTDENEIILYMIANHESMILKTMDKGKNWSVYHMADSSYLNGYSFFFLDKNHGWRSTQSLRQTSGQDSGMYYDRIYFTSNGGESWSKIYEEPDSWEHSSTPEPLVIRFYDENNGVALSRYANLSFTTDGGKTWKKEFETSNEFPYIFNDAAYAGSKDNLFILTYADNMLVYRAKASGIEDNTVPGTSSSASFKLLSPTGSITTSGPISIEIQSGKERPYKIDAFTLNGDYAGSPGRGYFKTGRQTIDLDLENLNRNLYLIRISSGNETQNFFLYKR